MKEKVMTVLFQAKEVATPCWEVISSREALEFYWHILNICVLVLTIALDLGIRGSIWAWNYLTAAVELPSEEIDAVDCWALLPADVQPGEVVSVADMVITAMETNAGRHWFRSEMIGRSAVCDRRVLVEAWLTRGLADFRESLKKKEVLTSLGVTPRPIKRYLLAAD